MTSDLKKKNINYEIQMQISDYAQCYVLCINDNSSRSSLYVPRALMQSVSLIY